MGATEPADAPLVVCVDDEPAVLAALRRAFAREPVELLTTESPSQAMEWVRTRRVRMLITDQRMPEMAGTEVLRRVRELSPGTILILLTAYPDAELFVDSLRFGARRLLSKPWDDRGLRWIVGELLAVKPGGTPPRS